MNKKKMIGGILGVLVAIAISVVPVSEPLTQKSMMALGFLVGAVVWILFNFMADFLAMLAMCCAFVAFGVVPLNVAFGSYATSTMWLMIGAFGIATAATESGLVQRIALWMLKTLPATFRGQVLAYIFSGLIVSPIIPSSTAKAVIASVLARSTSEAMGFAPGSKGARGLFVAMFTGYVSVALGFLSGSAVNVSIAGSVPDAFKPDWLGWLWIAWPWMVIATILMVLAIFKMYTPKDAPVMTKEYCRERYAALGPMNWKERLCLIVVLAALVLWMSERWLGINSAVVACGAFIILLAAGTFTSAQFRSKTPWESWIFVGCFLCLPGVFARHGINAFLTQELGPIIGPMMENMVLLALVVCALTFIIRLVFVSLTGTTILMITFLLPFCEQYGVHPFMVAYIAYVSTNTWNVSYQNTTTIAALAATDNKMVKHSDIIGGSVAYMITSTAAVLLCLPIWKLMGLY